MTLYNIVDLDEKEQVDLIFSIKSVNPKFSPSFMNLCILRLCILRLSRPTVRWSPSGTTSSLPGIPRSEWLLTEKKSFCITRGSNIHHRYGNVTHSRLPWESVWSPDILLHNPAGSNFHPIQRPHGISCHGSALACPGQNRSLKKTSQAMVSKGKS